MRGSGEVSGSRGGAPGVCGAPGGVPEPRVGPPPGPGLPPVRRPLVQEGPVRGCVWWGLKAARSSSGLPPARCFSVEDLSFLLLPVSWVLPRRAGFVARCELVAGARPPGRV